MPDGPPEKVHCVALTSTTIQVSWHPPEIHLRNGIVKGYKVLYAPRPRPAPSPSHLARQVPKISRLSTVTTVLENLLKFANYSIQVLAFTGAGDGTYSLAIDCATHSDGEMNEIMRPHILHDVTVKPVLSLHFEASCYGSGSGDRK